MRRCHKCGSEEIANDARFRAIQRAMRAGSPELAVQDATVAAIEVAAGLPVHITDARLRLAETAVVVLKPQAYHQVVRWRRFIKTILRNRTGSSTLADR